jgi:hypothetical protein
MERKPQAPKAKTLSFKVIREPEPVYELTCFSPIQDEATGEVKGHVVRTRRVK